MSEAKSIRLLKNDKNLIIRAINVMMFSKRRYSFKEKEEKIAEYEKDIEEGSGELLYNDLVSFKYNKNMVAEQQEEVDRLIEEVGKLINSVKERKYDKESEITKFNDANSFFEWFDKTIDNKSLNIPFHNISIHIYDLYNKNQQIVVNEKDDEFYIGISDEKEKITWVDDFTAFLVELKRRLDIKKDESFKKSYDAIRRYEKNINNLINNQMR